MKWLVIAISVVVVLWLYAHSTATLAPGLSPQRVEASSLNFHGHGCALDCSGHEAGYAWADDQDITDDRDCVGNSQSFIEGCKTYVAEYGSNNLRDDDSDDK